MLADGERGNLSKVVRRTLQTFGQGSLEAAVAGKHWQLSGGSCVARAARGRAKLAAIATGRELRTLLGLPVQAAACRGRWGQ